MPFYENVAPRCEIEVYDGSDFSNITALAGPENVNLRGDIPQVRVCDGRWQNVYPGWAVRRTPGGLFVMSAAALAEDWRQLP